MNRNNYIISFISLKNGTHYFDFEINDMFFDLFEDPIVSKGQLFAKIELVKSTNLLTLKVNIKGGVEVECDRCLDTYSSPIDYNSKLYIKISDSLAEDDKNEDIDMIVLTTHDHEFDISQYLYECIVLNLPLKKIHPKGENGEDLCNYEMLKLLNKHSNSIENGEIDPRWNELKNLVENKK